MKRKVIDCFTYFQEDDILEIRLNVLNPVVDYFVICESNRTHTNKPKPYNLESVLETRFKEFKHKIIYIQYDASVLPDELDFTKAKKYTPTDGHWYIEQTQRKSLRIGIDALNLENDDVVIISDLDEIPFPETITNFETGVSKIVMWSKWYYLNIVRKDCTWARTTIGTWENLKMYDCESMRWLGGKMIPEAGLHLTYCGGAEMVISKLKSFSHTEYSGKEFTNLENVTDAMNMKGNLLDANDKQIVETEFEEITFPRYPQWLVDNQHKYNHLIKEIK